MNLHGYYLKQLKLHHYIVQVINLFTFISDNRLLTIRGFSFHLEDKVTYLIEDSFLGAWVGREREIHAFCSDLCMDFYNFVLRDMILNEESLISDAN